jgi:hypothetical protein
MGNDDDEYDPFEKAAQEQTDFYGNAIYEKFSSSYKFSMMDISELKSGAKA